VIELKHLKNYLSNKYTTRYWWFGKNYNATIMSPTSARVLVEYSPHNWLDDAEKELRSYDSAEHSYSSDEEESQSERESNSENSDESPRYVLMVNF